MAIQAFSPPVADAEAFSAAPAEPKSAKTGMIQE
jgi:hypothetical protein